MTLISEMTQQHPITPPSDLLKLWRDQFYSANKDFVELLIEAAQWGADQELKACCEWLESEPDPGHVDLLRSCATALRAVRRPCPKPPSLKEQAQADLKRLIALIPTEGAIAMAEPIRKALEALPDD